MALRNIRRGGPPSTPGALGDAEMIPTLSRLISAVGSARRACAVLALAAAAASAGGAQEPAVGGIGVRRAEVTRAELEALAAQAEQAAASATGAEKEQKQSEVAALRARLAEGDFFPGDQFILTVQGGETPLADTVVVGVSRVVALQGLPEIPLRGVLRSELQAHLTKELGRYIRTPVVTTRPLLRLTLQGGVGKPGFYVLPTDLALTDVIMQAGGPVTNAVLDKTVIRRADAVVLKGNDVDAAFRQGLSIDQLGLRSGDVVNVGVKQPRNLTAAVQIITAGLSLLGLIVGLASR